MIQKRCNDALRFFFAEHCVVSCTKCSSGASTLVRAALLEASDCPQWTWYSRLARSHCLHV